MKHTPGPWVACVGGSGWRVVADNPPRIVVVADDIGPGSNQEAEADARLMAAAPELLEALRLFVYLYGKDDVREWMRVRDQAVAAIAKAERKA